jgi:hypothetical protein
MSDLRLRSGFAPMTIETSDLLLVLLQAEVASAAFAASLSTLGDLHK